jgi:hypothetical protein
VAVVPEDQNSALSSRVLKPLPTKRTIYPAVQTVPSVSLMPKSILRFFHPLPSPRYTELTSYDIVPFFSVISSDYFPGCIASNLSTYLGGASPPPPPHPDCTNMKILGNRCCIFCSYFKILSAIHTTENAQRRSDQNLETCAAGHLDEQSHKSWVVSTPLASYVLVLG